MKCNKECIFKEKDTPDTKICVCTDAIKFWEASFRADGISSDVWAVPADDVCLWETPYNSN